ncbi:MAG: hypothetical protein CBD58_03730 [bacterium TMED198]|nr:MAG: hypothetical protein CBD58_03730 [bacterium TMED198]
MIDNIAAKVDNILVFDSGNLYFKKDKVDQGVASEVAINTANIIVDAFNVIGCDAFSPGSQDFAMGLKTLKELEARSNFDYISANIYDRSGTRLFKPYKIISKGDLKIAVIGLASNFESLEVKVKDPIDDLQNIIFQIKDESDFIVLLFNSTEIDISMLHKANLPIDLVIRSNSRKKSKDGGSKVIPIYSVGDKGKQVYRFDVYNSNNQDIYVDKTVHLNRLKNVKSRLDRMKKDDPGVDLMQKYADDKSTLNKIKNYKSQLEESNYILNNLTNYIATGHTDLGKRIDSRADILQIIDIGKARVQTLPMPQK